ncbi:MAG TPA: ATP-binding protein [Baekduia sp.]|uniref:HAMP domain-containing sensor histidine kinase n=1 Tax=Baekduia sp. TaxID=2600305 RepID=UPI002BC41991|nr:ATP-binding protein [Baekduia sp.]HMJ36279.1 ATP-binding protein [Baekduia sp.]
MTAAALRRLAAVPALPHRTLRLRLTMLYGALFLISGVAVLTITYVLVRHNSGHLVVVKLDQLPGAGDQPAPPLPDLDAMRSQAGDQRSRMLSQLLTQSGVALAIMSVLSIGLGWLMAGRALRPLRTMTASARRISHHNLHERLAMEGPRDEMKDLGDTIDELLGRLEEAFASQRRFVANASHELRTPLAMMRTSVDVATGKPEPVPPQVAALGDKVREGLDQAERLLESFLMLARAQHGTVDERDRVALAPLVAAALDSLGDGIAERGIRVEQDVGDAAIDGNRTLLARLVDNLMDNAIRHNEPGGWVRIRATQREESTELVVENGGAHLTPGDVRALAEPFRRLGGHRVRSADGQGLGLSIVAAVAAAHGGDLHLEARADGGMRASVTVPLVVLAVAVGIR